MTAIALIDLAHPKLTHDEVAALQALLALRAAYVQQQRTREAATASKCALMVWHALIKGAPVPVIPTLTVDLEV